jgi:hypothetical protein
MAKTAKTPAYKHTGSSVSGDGYAFAIYRDQDAPVYSGYAVRLVIHDAGDMHPFFSPHSVIIPADTFMDAHNQGERFAHCWRAWRRVR